MCGPGQPRNWNDDVHAVNMRAVGTPPLQSPVLLFSCQVYLLAGGCRRSGFRGNL